MEFSDVEKYYGRELVNKYICYFKQNLGWDISPEQLMSRLDVKPELKGLSDEIYQSVKAKTEPFEPPEFILAQSQKSLLQQTLGTNLDKYSDLIELRCVAYLALIYKQEFEKDYLLWKKENPDVMLMSLDKNQDYKKQEARFVEVTSASVDHTGEDTNQMIIERILAKYRKNYGRGCDLLVEIDGLKGIDPEIIVNGLKGKESPFVNVFLLIPQSLMGDKVDIVLISPFLKVFSLNVSHIIQ